MLERMGFEKKRFRWIKYCISTIKLIEHLQGFSRQGDLLSPFLFLITMEGLSSMIKISNTKARVKGFGVTREGSDSLEVTHLQYGNDTLMFCDVDEQQTEISKSYIDSI